MHDAPTAPSDAATTLVAGGAGIPRLLHRVRPDGADPSGPEREAFATWTDRNPGWVAVTWTVDDLQRLDPAAPPERAWRSVLGRFGGLYVAEGFGCRRSVGDDLATASLAVGRSDGRLAFVAAAPGRTDIALLTADGTGDAVILDDVVLVASRAVADPPMDALVRMAVDLGDADGRASGLSFVGHVARRFRARTDVELLVVADDDEESLPALLEQLADVLYGIDEPPPIDLVSAGDVGAVDLTFRPRGGVDAPRRLLDALDVVDAIHDRAGAR